MNINFNKKRLIELIQYSEKLLSEGKFFFEEDRAASSELSNYMNIISDSVYWSNRKDFFKPIQLFLDRKIDGEEFRIQFFDVWRYNRDLVKDYQKNIEALQNFELIPKAIGFSSLPSELSSIVDLFVEGNDEESVEYREEYGGLDEDDLRYYVQDFFNAMKKYD